MSRRKKAALYHAHKVSYGTWDEAEAAALSTILFNQTHKPPMQIEKRGFLLVYACKLCGRYHVGHATAPPYY